MAVAKSTCRLNFDIHSSPRPQVMKPEAIRKRVSEWRSSTATTGIITRITTPPGLRIRPLSEAV